MTVIPEGRVPVKACCGLRNPAFLAVPSAPGQAPVAGGGVKDRPAGSSTAERPEVLDAGAGWRTLFSDGRWWLLEDPLSEWGGVWGRSLLQIPGADFRGQAEARLPVIPSHPAGGGMEWCGRG